MVSLFYCFIPVILIILEDLLMSNLPFKKFGAQMGLDDEQSKFGRSKYWYTFAGFMTNMPYLAKITMESVIFFHAYFTIWDVNLVPAQMNFTDMKVMKSMG